MTPYLDPATVKESIAYLVSTFRIDAQEALRRLNLQHEAQKLDEVLNRDLPDSYGGMALEHESGGELVIALTKADAADRYIAGMRDRAHVKVRTVRYSLAELRSVSDRVSAVVQAGPDAVYLPGISESENRVILWEREWVATEKRAGTWQGKSPSAAPAAKIAREAEVAREAAAARKAIAEGVGRVVHRKLHRSVPLQTPYVNWGYCHPLFCSGHGPMRGGIRLDIKRDNGTWGGCTAGFNARSKGLTNRGWAYVLTAGHCVVGRPIIPRCATTDTMC